MAEATAPAPLSSHLPGPLSLEDELLGLMGGRDPHACLLQHLTSCRQEDALREFASMLAWCIILL